MMTFLKLQILFYVGKNQVQIFFYKIKASIIISVFLKLTILFYVDNISHPNIFKDTIYREEKHFLKKIISYLYNSNFKEKLDGVVLAKYYHVIDVRIFRSVTLVLRYHSRFPFLRFGFDFRMVQIMKMSNCTFCNIILYCKEDSPKTF